MFTKPTFENNLYMRIFRWLYIGFALNISFGREYTLHPHGNVLGSRS